MSTAIVKKDQVLQEAHGALSKLLKSKSEALPKDFNQTRFMQNCMTVLQDTKDIEQCEPVSIARCMLKGAFLGLDFFNKECYAIKYGNQLNFQTDYKGEIKLAKKYSINEIKDIYAKLVRDGDNFEESITNGQQTINFKPKPFNNGEILGTFAVVLFQDGSMLYETMSKQDIEDIRQGFSKAKDSAAWQKTYGEMAKKTVLRRLCKLIELDFDTIEQKKVFDESSDYEFKNNSIEKPKEKSPFETESNVVEAEYKVEEGANNAAN